MGYYVSHALIIFISALIRIQPSNQTRKKKTISPNISRVGHPRLLYLESNSRSYDSRHRSSYQIRPQLCDCPTTCIESLQLRRSNPIPPSEISKFSNLRVRFSLVLNLYFFFNLINHPSSDTEAYQDIFFCISKKEKILYAMSSQCSIFDINVTTVYDQGKKEKMKNKLSQAVSHQRRDRKGRGKGETRG